MEIMGIDFANLNWFDIGVLSIILLSTVFAFFRGFIKATFSTLTWIISITTVFVTRPYSIDFLQNHLEDSKIIFFITSVGTFIITFIIFAIITSKIVYKLRRQRHSAIDCTLGIAFGCARGILIVCFIFFLTNLSFSLLHLGDENKPGPEWFTNAKTYNMLNLSTQTILSYLPDSVPETIISYIEDSQTKVLSMFTGDDKDLENKTATPKTLSDNDKKILAKIMSLLPQEELQNLNKKYEGKTKHMSPAERSKVYLYVLQQYDNAISHDKIPAEKQISPDDLATLRTTLTPPKQKNKSTPTNSIIYEEGYNKHSIKQIDRLVINTLQEE